MCRRRETRGRCLSRGYRLPGPSSRAWTDPRGTRGRPCGPKAAIESCGLLFWGERANREHERRNKIEKRNRHPHERARCLLVRESGRAGGEPVVDRALAEDQKRRERIARQRRG